MLTFLNCDAQYWWTKHICQWNCQHSTWIGHIPVFLLQNLIKKHLHFQKTILWEEITLMWIEQIPITPSKYVHARLKCCDDRFAANPQYIFHALEIVLKEMLLQAWFILLKGKEIESEINVGQLINYVDIRRIIWDNQIFRLPLKTSEELCSTFTICSWMSLLNLDSLGGGGVYTFFLNCSTAKFC